MLKNILITLLAGVLLCGFSGCPSDSVRSDVGKTPPAESKVATNVEAPTNTQTPEQQKVTSLEKQLEAANKKADEATARGDLVAKLTAEKDALVIREQISISNAKQWEANANAYHSQAADKDVEIKNAKIDAWKERLWILSGICGLLAIVAGGIAIGFPLLRPVAWKAGAILAGIASLMLIVAQLLPTVAWLLGLVPYILGIGAAIGLFYGAVALRHWFKDHTSLKQVLTGVEPLKEQIVDFGDHMSKFIDTPMETHIKEMRTQLGLKKIIDPAVEDELQKLRKALVDKEAELASALTKEVAKVEKAL